jgi:hypothetical protein
MSLFGWDLIWKLLIPEPPKFPNTREAPSEDIPAAAKRLNELWLGRPATGKTAALARQMVDHLVAHPEEAMVSFDGSQSFTDTFLKIVLSQPKPVRDALLKRIIYDELGHPEWVLTLPEFHESYEVPFEKQIQRATQNLEALNPELITQTPVIGGLSVHHYGRELFRLITCIKNDLGGTWQITEAKRLLTDRKLLSWALKNYGHLAGNAKWFLEEKYMKLKADEADMRVLGLISVLDDIEAPEIRPRVGFHRPSYTIPDIIRNGKSLLVNAIRVNDQDRTLAQLLIHVKSLVMNEISKRTPDNPFDFPFTLLLDELPSLLDYADMQKTIMRAGTYYRSRKLQTCIVAQELSQFPPELLPHIWGYANITCFSLLNADDAYELAKQLFPYIPNTVKAKGKTDSSQDIYEPDRGQYLQIANQIRNLKHRECIARRQISQTESERYVLWVKRTKDALMTASDREVQELKDELLQKYGERVNEVTAAINRRIDESQRRFNENQKGEKSSTPPNLR